MICDHCNVWDQARIDQEVGMVSARPLDLAARGRSLAYLSHLGRVARSSADAALKPLGLRPWHLILLTLLTEEGGTTTQQALGDILLLDPSNVVGLLNELEERGLIERLRSPDDRRRHVVVPTDAGRQILLGADHRLATAESELLAALDDDERDTLRGLLQKATRDRVVRCSEGLPVDARHSPHAPVAPPARG
jgi:DNA-binding MarR family transcriptional regulator